MQENIENFGTLTTIVNFFLITIPNAWKHMYMLKHDQR